VHRHVIAIRSAADIDFDVIRSRANGVLDGSQCVFMGTSVVASVSDHYEVVAASWQIQGLRYHSANQYQKRQWELHPSDYGTPISIGQHPTS
jgi:hypothetical protein